jgi:hypothetical protein
MISTNYNRSSQLVANSSDAHWTKIPTRMSTMIPYPVGPYVRREVGTGFSSHSLTDKHPLAMHGIPLEVTTIPEINAPNGELLSVKLF